MNALWVVLYFIAGAAGTHLLTVLASVHPDMPRAKASDAWSVLTGPFILFVAVFIALRYALGWNGFKHKEEVKK